MARINKTQYYLIFLLFFISFGYFFQGGGWNQKHPHLSDPGNSAATLI